MNYRSKLTIFSSFELYSFHENNSYHVIYKHHLHRRSRQNRHNNGYESIKLNQTDNNFDHQTTGFSKQTLTVLPHLTVVTGLMYRVLHFRWFYGVQRKR